MKTKLSLRNKPINVKEYFRKNFFGDIKAGLITSIVALPLAVSFAIASGVSPLMGLHTAIIAGVVAAIVGGSPFSITGPSAAMSLIILSTIQKYNIEGLLVAGFLSGLFMLLFSVLGLGIAIKFIPLPVVSGYTAGIGTVILLGQIPNFLGVSIAIPAHTWELFPQICGKIFDANWQAIVICTFTVLCMIFLPKRLVNFRYIKNLPASIFALMISVSLIIFCQFNVATIGAIPTSSPSFHFFTISPTLIIKVMPAAFTIALLGAIESLFCAMVADGMTSTKHDSNRELFGQGITNLILPFFGTIPATAAVARTAVNIREGAKTRLAAVYHALFLLCMLLFLGRFATYLPKSFLAGILFVAAIRMMNFRELRTILALSKSDTIVYFSAFFFTVFTDLVVAIQISMLLAIFLLFLRLVNVFQVASFDNDSADHEIAQLITPELKDKVAIFTLHGPFFFGVMNLFEQKVNEHLHTRRPVIVLCMEHVPFIDATAVVRLKQFIREKHKQGGLVLVSVLCKEVENVLREDDDFIQLLPKEHRFKTTKLALEFVKKTLEST